VSANGVAGAPAPERSVLEVECDRFARYLIGEPPRPYVRDWYVKGHAVGPGRFAPDGGLDATLLSLSAWRGVPLRALDMTGRVLAPGGALRRKLVLLVAILECAPGSAERFEAPDHGSPAGFFLALAGRGLVSVAALALGLAVVAVARLGGVGARGAR